MCVVCGCSNPEGHAHGHGHTHDHTHGHAHDADLDFGANSARVSVPGMSAERAIRLEADVLGANDRVARANRAHFEAHGVVAYNLVSSPGSGKTTLLVATIEALRRAQPDLRLAVIEGDQQTHHDADRIRATGVPAIQVNTGKGCHLDAPMVAAAFERLPLHAHAHGPAHDDHHAHLLERGARSLLFIENVGNLVCPAMWDLGERAKVAILSVTEGEDKPLKYPDMFAAAKLMVLTKSDLLPHVDFDVAHCIAYARRVNPAIEVLLLSAKSGQGMDAWLDWLQGEVGEPAAAVVPASRDETAALKARIAELEARLAQVTSVQGAAT
ncbi:MAG: hydrogenase nickel incorporation protein HypB [Aquincola sp.]|nr:hydrogenase nickel incorporation protein HypB [Aquincola sp.]MDH4287750.1 hydrogenase nickel incorporation protein HypB [Aquincola sp.]MDH5329873.1 hydrogenase nickel incorporation protein HypB [Aquincola sp.]